MKRILVYIQTLVRDIKIVNTNSVGRFLMLGETIYFTCVGLFAHSLQITGRNCFKLFLEAAFRNYFFKIGLLKNFAIFRVKHFCWGLFLIKKRLSTGVYLAFVLLQEAAVNPFHIIGLLHYPLKTSQNLWFSHIFNGYRKRKVAYNGLMRFLMSKALLHKNAK